MGKVRERYHVNWVTSVFARILDQPETELRDWAQVPRLLPDWSNIRIVDQHKRWYWEIEKETQALLAHEKIAKVADILSDAATLLASDGRDAEASDVRSWAEAAANAAQVDGEAEERMS